MKLNSSIIIGILFILVFSPLAGIAQKSFTAEEYALALSIRMKDSLQLNDIEYEEIYRINRKIQYEIIQTHREFKQVDRNTLQKKIVELEKSRDKRYEKVLSDDKRRLYQTKKANLFKLK